MKRFIRIMLAAGVIVGLTAMDAAAQVTDTANLSVNATVSSRAKLTLGTASITFADSDPDTVPSITVAPINLTVKARKASGSVTVSVVASADLTSGTDTIGISNLTWTATGSGYVAGTMALTDQSLASFANSGSYAGTQTYALANSWTYATGSYSTTVTYTLTVP